jgi:hypothetical protein
MSQLHTFFHGADTHLGVFYPAGYFIAMFGDLVTAQEAEKELRFSGLVQPEEVLAVSGIEVILHDQENTSRPIGFLMTGLSRMFGTEAFWADRDLHLARKGCALLAVHCPSDENKRAVWGHIAHRKPLVARHYSLGLGGIEHFAGDPEVG